MIATILAKHSPYHTIINNLKIENSSSQEKIIKDEIEQTLIFFKSGKAELTKNGQSNLNRLQKLLKKIQFKQLYLIGHSDDKGSEELNNKISYKRAELVKKYLTDAGCDQAKVKIIAKGSKFPLDLNLTEEGRARNRRVQISFSPDL